MLLVYRGMIVMLREVSQCCTIVGKKIFHVWKGTDTGKLQASKLARYKNQKAALLGKNLVGILFLMVGKFL